jgi:hypothetical protein
MEMPPFLNSQLSMPSWFKRIAKKEGSLRSCAGINDFLSIGLTVPMWSNIFFRPNREHNFWESRVENMNPPVQTLMGIEGFPYTSTGECPVTSVRKMETMQYPKLVTPWRIETAPGWSCLVLPVSWEPNPDYDVLPAVVHTDFYHVANVVLNIKTDTDFVIKYGTPMVHLVPFERTKGLDKITFEDESNWKYVASTGFGAGHIMPSTGSAGPYRRARHVDRKLAEKKKRFWEK